MNWRLHCFVPGFLVFLALTSPPLALAGDVVVDAERGFTLTLPDGFVAYPEAVDIGAGVIHAFVLGDPGDDKTDFVLGIETMGGTIGRERLEAKDMPEGFEGRLLTLRWQGYDVDAICVPLVTEDDVEITTYSVQIPLRREAIQVMLTGETARETELRELLDEVLVNLSGETNWTLSEPSAAPPLRVVPLKSATRADHKVLIGVAIGLFVLGLIGYWLVSKYGPKWAVIATAVGVWVIAAAVRETDIREVALFSGTLLLLAYSGMVLGVIDLISKGKKKRPRDSRTSTNYIVNAEVVSAEVVEAEVIDDGTRITRNEPPDVP